MAKRKTWCECIQQYKIIDEEYLQNLMDSFSLTKEEAIYQYCEEEGFIENEELEKLERKAKESGLSRTIHEARKVEPKRNDTPKTKDTPKREKKPDLPKEELISQVAKFLESVGNVENVEIANKSKLITFTLNGETFKLDLIRQRTKK